MRYIARLGWISLAVALGGLTAMSAHAALDATGQQEVKALLSFVGNSGCSFIRNGSTYSAKEAQAHLQDKFDHLLRKDMVNSAEQFIELAGSQSSMSGKPYKVNCGGRERLSADWLTEELQRLRHSTP